MTCNNCSFKSLVKSFQKRNLLFIHIPPNEQKTFSAYHHSKTYRQRRDLGKKWKESFTNGLLTLKFLALYIPSTMFAKEAYFLMKKVFPTFCAPPGTTLNSTSGRHTTGWEPLTYTMHYWNVETVQLGSVPIS